VLPERAAPDRHEEALERDALWQHVQSLPARQRAVLVLRFYEDLSEAQTAALLEISPGTVKSQTARALTALRKRLAVDGIEPAVRAAPLPAAAPSGPEAEGALAPRPAPPGPTSRLSPLPAARERPPAPAAAPLQPGGRGKGR
jgi:hypothetical protein